MKTYRGGILSAVAALAPLAQGDYPITLPGVSQVKATEGFWFDRIETNRIVTLKTDFLKCSETPRIASFTNVAARAWGRFGGIFYDDSDVYKVMEGAAYTLATHPDPELERYMVWLIGQIAKAQEPDGYLCMAPLPADAAFSVEEVAVGGGRYPSLKSSTGLVLVPSCIWGNRQPGNDMQTWFADGIE